MERRAPGKATYSRQSGGGPGGSKPAGRAAAPGTDADAPVQFVKGVGPHRAEAFARMGVHTLKDLLWHLPRRYEDRRQFKPIRLLSHGAAETVSGRVTGGSTERRRGLQITRVLLVDDSGSAQLTWYNQPYMERRFPAGTHLVVHGKVERRYGAVQILNPECEGITGGDMVGMGRIVPIYPLTEGLGQPVVRNALFGLLPAMAQVPETLPEGVRRRHNLPDLATALRDIHFPETWEARDAAQRRLVFEEFFRLQLRLAAAKSADEARPGIAFRFTEAMAAEIREMLPFTLTGAQQRVSAEIAGDLQRERPMHRLLQGDVGSGKTAVAAVSALIAIRNGYQVALMAPTEILAEQHFLGLQRLFAPRGVAVDLLTGSMAEKEREAVRARLRAGDTHLAIGTHALIQEDVAFARLGLVIVDEQHRFGVLQRQSLWEKGSSMREWENGRVGERESGRAPSARSAKAPAGRSESPVLPFPHSPTPPLSHSPTPLVPDLLVMTATPIPRTLALTLYGDLDLSVLDELPPGRQPITTQWFAQEDRDVVCEFLREQLAQGRQAYYVCPLIEESDLLYAQSAVEQEAFLREVVPEFRVGLLHGRMKTAERAEAMDAFRAGQIDVLTCTTVIEVGVDVPNATVMVIEDADRFGLAQLHQLRGRVGRGVHRSHCLLITDKKHNPYTLIDGEGLSDGQRRMRVMVDTGDGFQIAEEDLQIRGPGELYGTRQSGFDAIGSLRVANVLRDSRELEEARAAAFALVAEDPELRRPEHAGLRDALAAPQPKAGVAVVG